ncbi:hypothetical protein M8J77_000350 [Diaphorina citri]|nr:hypothetical protein M8J77_000350 [Diaphorina citri]
MSHLTYNKLWYETQAILEEITQIDVEQQSVKPTKDRTGAKYIVSNLYVKYLVAINNLDQCYDQIVQPQKRILIRKILDNTIGRFLEIKHELVNLDLSEFNYYDNILLENKLLPMDVKVIIPRHYRRERIEDFKYKRQFVEDVLKKLGYLEEEEVEPPMTEAEAVRLIQIHERARQGRLRAQFMKEIRLQKDKDRAGKQKDISEYSRAAALKIQRIWRGYITRRKIRKRVIEEMLLIGMLPPSTTDVSARLKAEKVKYLRHDVQAEYQKQFEESLVREKELVKRYETGQISERIKDEIRTWYMAYKTTTGKFPDLPSEDSGGSALIFSRGGIADSDIVSKSSAPSSKESKGKKDKGKKGSKEDETKKKKPEEDEDLGFKMAPSNFLADLMVCNSEYDELWKHMDESSNPLQTHYLEMVRAAKTTEVEAELRKIIDEQMRNELENLQAALDRDRAKKSKKAKKSAKKGRRSGKKNKKKREKDLTPDRTLESLFEELVANGIIKKYPETPIYAFCGERSYAAHDLREQGKDPLPSLGDIRQVIMEYCILPLGSPMIHQNSPLVRSLLLTGPSGSGKNMLVHAVCTEIGAVLFDLSPENIVGKYPGKPGLIMLIHLVNKVSRLLQPAIIYMNGAEKPFLKKVPKTDKSDPKRLKKDLPKLVKGITNEDQIMLIGISTCPWECDQKSLAQTYQKMIYIPRPDYASLSYIWTELLFSYPSVSRQFNCSTLAKLSDGYTVGTILKVVREVKIT